ncbi:UNVERIFIED_ORG: hypothetical protein ABIB13_003280 [Arthrobacter sp. UYEF2]
MVLSGLRGVGKTVLLNVFAEHARRNDWLVIQLEAQPGAAGKKATRAKLARELEVGARRLCGKPAWSFLQNALNSIGNISASLGVAGVSASVTTKQGRADSGNLDIDLEELVEDVSLAMRKARGGFGLFIDEMQDLDEELLTILLSVQHLAGQRGWPFYIIGAGLPNLPGKISEARTYGERLFLYRTIGQVNEEAASEALALPINRLGASLAPDALSLLLSAANGYPFFLQVYGRAAWEASSEKIISADDARVAVRHGTWTTASSRPDGSVPPMQNASTSGPWPRTAIPLPRLEKSPNALGSRPANLPSSAHDSSTRVLCMHPNMALFSSRCPEWLPSSGARPRTDMR